MNKSLFAISMLAFAASGFAATKTYQVTGPVLETTDTSIVVQKGKEHWEIERDASTKVTGDIKTGDKVTVYYKMVATDVEAKAGGKAEGKKGQSKK